MSRNKADSERTLADSWTSPVIDEIEDIGTPLICIASTYTFHAPFFESELLPRFVGLRFDETEGTRPFIVEREQALAASRVCVLVDADHFDPSQSTLRWDQLSVRVPGGAQHSKVVVLLWEHCARLIVSSANLTRSGYRRNREIAGVIDFHDGETSAPRAPLLDVIGFLETLSNWVRAPEATRIRLREALNDVRTRLRSWRGMPADFRPMQRPRATFIGGLPLPNGRVAESPLGQLIELWGTRRASEVTVMTPFVGELTERIAPIVEKLLQIPRTREAIGSLVVPGYPSEERGRMIVGLPRTFLESWSSAWRMRSTDVRTYVVPLHREGEPAANRDLHAKAILLYGENAAMLLCGSSNFSQHGMGVGAAHAEANLCYLDDPDVKRGRLRLLDRLPVDWDNDLSKNPIWLDATEPIEDERESTDRPLPSAFLWGIYNQQTALLKVVVDPAAEFPAEWSLRWPGEHETKTAALIDHRQCPKPPPTGQIVLQLPVSLRGANIAALRLEWQDETDATQTASLPVHVESGEDLLPPEEFRLLTAEGILECLLSGREPAEWVDALERSRMNGKQHLVQRELDSLRAIDTSGYILFRTRRFGAAITALGERLLRTVRTREAMAYRLRQDPIGPRLFAEALLREWRELPVEGNPARDPAILLFNLAEIKLVLSHVARRISEEHLRLVFRETIQEIDQHCRDIEATSVPPPPNLTNYLNAVKIRSDQLL